jgi:hypothetical protein
MNDMKDFFDSIYIQSVRASGSPIRLSAFDLIWNEVVELVDFVGCS